MKQLDYTPRHQAAPSLLWHWIAHCVALPGLALALVACGGTETQVQANGDSGTQVDGNPSALTVSKPGEITRFVQNRLRTLNNQGQLASAGRGAGGDVIIPVAINASPSADAAAALPRSSTLVQEEGVDEADLIQTDGRFIYTLQPQVPQVGVGNRLAVYESATSNGRAKAITSVPLPTYGATSSSTDGMVLSADQRTLAIISQHWSYTSAYIDCPGICAAKAPQWASSSSSSVNVQRVDVSNPSAAKAGEGINIDGQLVDSRRIGDALYVVTTHSPVLGAEQLPASATSAERETAIAQLGTADLLPRLRRNGGTPEPLLADTDCYVQNTNASTSVQFTTVTVFDLKSPTLAHNSRCFVGGSEAVYMSPDNLYIATTRWTYPSAVASAVASAVFPGNTLTDIHKFALVGGTVSYRGSGSVDGHLGWDPQRKSYRLSEHKGDLRVLSFTGGFGWFTVQDAQAVPASPARLTVLRERSTDQTLQTVATLPNSKRPEHIGKPGEQVYAVRFLGDLAYVVTFRRTDPLYALDLSNPDDPKTGGELQVPGFSDYLFPLPNQLLLGVGHDADKYGRITGVKVALFDVAKPEALRPINAVTLGSAGSSSALDSSRHGLNLLLKNNIARVALPVSLARTPYYNWQHGLQKFEVDTTARTLRDLGLAEPVDNSVQTSPGLDRSVQIGDKLYYLNNGNLDIYAW
ncbi:MAG: beta-propeller domain-containing protein [Rhodoferax sp.]|nr:beta-propeller domain-containing protein [Rhodoferax sp.]